MKFAWVDDGVGNGPVVSINVPAQEGQIEGTIVKQQLTKGRKSQYYKVVDYEFTVKSDEEISEVDKKESYQYMLEAVNEENRQRNLKEFPYEKAGVTNYYVSDQDSIQGTQNDISGSIALGESLDDLIPTPNGVWKTADVEADGITPIYVVYTKGEFLEFASAFFTRSSNNFGVKEVHKANLRTLLEDPTKTKEDILSYDYSEGWY